MQHWCEATLKYSNIVRLLLKTNSMLIQPIPKLYKKALNSIILRDKAILSEFLDRVLLQT